MTFRPTHEQVMLDDLGFSVDRGLEDLVRACWSRGIATDMSCIGSTEEYDEHPGDAWIGFSIPSSALRWEMVTGVECEWNDDDEIFTVAEAYFPPTAISTIVERLRDGISQ